jgi:hypothetical protein
MKDKYQLNLSKRDAQHLFTSMILAEDTKMPCTKRFWERHEKLIVKLQGVIYNAGKPVESSEKPKP